MEASIFFIKIVRLFLCIMNAALWAQIQSMERRQEEIEKATLDELKELSEGLRECIEEQEDAE